MEKKRLNRREFLQLAALAGAGMVLAACGGKPTEAPATAAPRALNPLRPPQKKTPPPSCFGSRPRITSQSTIGVRLRSKRSSI